MKRDPLHRCWEKLEPQPNGCWLWTGAVNTNGYGRIWIGRALYVHRWIYELLVGPVPAGHDVGHRCHDDDLTCPGGHCAHRLCCNPAHLVPQRRLTNLLAGRTIIRAHAAREDCGFGGCPCCTALHRQAVAA